MHNVRQDFQIGIRNYLSTPGVTIVALLTLALGIGANTAIFSLLNAVTLRPLPVPHPEQLVALSTRASDSVNTNDAFTVPMFIELNRQQREFAHLFAWYGGELNNFEANGRHLTAALASVSGEYYEAMQITPVLGRFITKNDVALESGISRRLAVISYRVWRSWYQADSQIIGKIVRIEDRPFTIIGVEPEGYSGLIIDGSTDVTVPLFSTGLEGPSNPRDPRVAWINVYGRLQPGGTQAQARVSLETRWPHILEASRPPGYEGLRLQRFNTRRINLQPASKGISSLRQRFSPSLQVLLGLVGAVLLIACLNLANLASARTLARRHQLGVRSALGASTWDLMQLPIIESLLLTFVGALFGVALAYGMSRLVLRTVWTGLVSTPLSTSLDRRVLAFTAAVTFLAGLLFAVAPAWFAARTDVRQSLSQQKRSIHGGFTKLGKALLIGQIAFSLLLVNAALLFGETLVHLHTIDLGYRRDHLLTVTLFPQAAKLQPQIPSTYYRELVDEIKRVPGVDSASFSYLGPASDAANTEVLRPVFDSTKQGSLQAVYDVIGPDFFHVAGMHLISGREFKWDDADQTPGPVIISQSLAEHLFGHQQAVGQIAYIGPIAHADQVTVVGVVNSASLWQVQAVHPLAIYRPLAYGFVDMNPLLHIRTTMDPRSVKIAAERAIQSLGQHYSLRTLTGEESLENVINVQRLTAILSSFFGGVALLIASIGLYGLLLMQVTGRTTEFGVRLALGAQAREIWSLVLKQVMLWVGSGLALGLAISWVTLKLVTALLFGVAPGSPGSLILAVLILVTVAILAALIPLKRAASVDPITALRSD